MLRAQAEVAAARPHVLSPGCCWLHVSFRTPPVRMPTVAVLSTGSTSSPNVRLTTNEDGAEMNRTSLIMHTESLAPGTSSSLQLMGGCGPAWSHAEPQA